MHRRRMRGWSASANFRLRKRLLQNSPCTMCSAGNAWDHRNGCISATNEDLTDDVEVLAEDLVPSTSEVQPEPIATSSIVRRRVLVSEEFRRYLGLKLPRNFRSDLKYCLMASKTSPPVLLRSDVNADEEANESSHNLPTPVTQSSQLEYISIPEAIPAVEPSTSCDISNAALLQAINKILQQQQEALQKLLTEQNSYLKSIQESICQLTSDFQCQRNVDNESIHMISPHSTTRSKCQTAEELDEFCDSLDSPSNMEKMMSKFCLLGGFDLSDCVRRILSALMSNDVSMKFNWSGTFGKRRASDIKFVELVHKSVHGNTQFKECTQHEIDVHIQRWFRNARDQSGGRTRRSNVKS